MITRFEEELSGILGDFWKKHAEAELTNLKDSIDNGDVIFEEDGAIKWKSNERYVPDDICEKIEFIDGVEFNRTATQIKRDKQLDESARKYRESMKNHKCTEEELFEMRCAFGAGTKVVDVITGEEITV